MVPETHAEDCRTARAGSCQPPRGGVIIVDSRRWENKRLAGREDGCDELLHHHDRWRSTVVRIDARIRDITEGITQDIDKAKLRFHIARHATRETGEFVPYIFLEHCSAPASHFSDLSVRVAGEG